MSVFEQIKAATDNHDAEAYLALMADDCEFVRHQTGSTMKRGEVEDMLRNMMSNSSMVFGDRRCIYENDDILVMHSINDYPDGSREAVLASYSLKDGKITRLETGATLLPSEG